VNPVEEDRDQRVVSASQAEELSRVPGHDKEDDKDCKQSEEDDLQPLPQFPQMLGKAHLASQSSSPAAPSLGDKRICQVLVAALLHDLVGDLLARLPDGWDTELSRSLDQQLVS